MITIVMPACGRQATTCVEAFQPSWKSIDAVVYVCADHGGAACDAIQSAGLWAYTPSITPDEMAALLVSSPRRCGHVYSYRDLESVPPAPADVPADVAGDKEHHETGVPMSTIDSEQQPAVTERELIREIFRRLDRIEAKLDARVTGKAATP